MKKGNLIIISGPSGVGKSTIREELLKINKNIWYSISMTTRKPRGVEENEIDYFFVSKTEFLDNIKNNNLIEYVEVYKDTFYGTPRKEIEKRLNKGIDVLLEIDVEGAFKVKSQYMDALMIFIAPPSLEDLEIRLRNRNTDSNEKIIERLNKAKYELTQANKYDFLVVNKDVESAANQINDYIIKNKK